MAKSPADRYATAQEFMAALTEVAHDRVRQTAPGRTTIPPREPTAGNGEQWSAAPGVGSERPQSGQQGLPKSERDGWDRLSRYALYIAIAVGATATFLFVLGLFSTAIYDSRLQIPAEFTPSRTDFLVVGIQALVPFFVFSGMGFGLFFLLKYFFRISSALANMLPAVGPRVSSADAWIRAPWRGLASDLHPKAAYDALFAFALLVAIAILIRSWSLFVPLFTSETAALSCSNRAAHWSFSLVSIYFTAAITFFWVQFAKWTSNQGDSPSSSGFSRWATVVLVLAMLTIRAVPYRLIYETNSERVRIDGQRGYIVAAGEARIAIYDPVTQRALSYASNDPRIERLGIKGYTFEEIEAFESGEAACLSLLRR